MNHKFAPLWRLVIAVVFLAGLVGPASATRRRSPKPRFTNRNPQSATYC